MFKQYSEFIYKKLFQIWELNGDASFASYFKAVLGGLAIVTLYLLLGALTFLALTGPFLIYFFFNKEKIRKSI